MAVHRRAASSPPEEERKKHKVDKNCLTSRPRLKAHTRGHPCRECWRQADRTRPLIQHATGACHQQGISRPHPSLAAQGVTVLRAGLFRRGASPPSPVFLFVSLLAPIVIPITMSALILGGGRVSDVGASLTSDPMTRPKLVCACLPLLPDPVSYPPLAIVLSIDLIHFGTEFCFLAVVEHVARPGNVHGDPEVGHELLPLSGHRLVVRHPHHAGLLVRQHVGDEIDQ